VDVPVERFPQALVADHDEVPRLGQSDAGCGVRRGEDAVEDVGSDGFAGELAADVAAAVDDVVDVAAIHGQAPAALAPHHPRVGLMARGRSSDSQIDAGPPAFPAP
jgi:hypothetical protein